MQLNQIREALSTTSYTNYVVSHECSSTQASSLAGRVFHALVASCYRFPLLCAITYISEHSLSFLATNVPGIGLLGVSSRSLDLSHPPALTPHPLHLSHQNLRAKASAIWEKCEDPSVWNQEAFLIEFDDYMQEANREMELWFRSLEEECQGDLAHMAARASIQQNEPGEANYCYCFFNDSFLAMYQWLRTSGQCDQALYFQQKTRHYQWRMMFNQLSARVQAFPKAHLRDNRFYDLAVGDHDQNANLVRTGAPSFYGPDPLKLDPKYFVFDWDTHLKKMESILGTQRVGSFDVKEFSKKQTECVMAAFMGTGRSSVGSLPLGEVLTQNQRTFLEQNKKSIMERWKEEKLAPYAQLSRFQDPERLRVQRTVSALLIDQWDRVLYLLRDDLGGRTTRPSSLEEFKQIIRSLKESDDKVRLLEIVEKASHPIDLMMCKALEHWVEDKNLMLVFPRVCQALSGTDELQQLEGKVSAKEKAQFIRQTLARFAEEANKEEQQFMLDLQDLQLTNVPQAIFRFEKISVLNLKSNHLNVLPNGLSGLYYLENLDLSHNDLRGIRPYQIPLFHLKTLNLQGNPQVAKLPKQVKEQQSKEGLTVLM